MIRAEGAILRQSSASKRFNWKIVLWALEGGKEPRRSKQRGSGLATFMRRTPSKLVLPSHEPLPLSKAASVGGWRFMQKWFSGRGFVAARDARRCSGFARTAIAGSAIAARLAARKLDAGNAVPPTAATKRSLEGRLDHRDRQRAYRQRHAPARVTDQGSLSVISPAPFGCGETIARPVVVPLPSELPGGLEKRPDLWMRCSICGRPGRFVNPFPQIPRRR